MIDAQLLNLAMLLQPTPPRMTTDAISFTVKVGLFLIVFIIVMYFVIMKLRKNRDMSVSAEINEEFEKGKEALLLAAQARKSSTGVEKKEDRQVSREQKEMELLAENVDPRRVLGQTCPLSGMEMMADQELVIDPYSGQGYHFSAFLNDWPSEAERPKFVYRYPMGTVVKSSNLLRSF